MDLYIFREITGTSLTPETEDECQVGKHLTFVTGVL